MSLKYFARGANFMGQLGISNGLRNVTGHYERIEELEGRNVLYFDTYFTQSFALLDDGQVLHWGNHLDALTTARTLNWYQRQPYLCTLWQKYSPFGRTLSMRTGSPHPNLMNADLVNKVRIKKMSAGGCFILCLTDEGVAYGLGENYKGQLGVGDSKFQHNFVKIQLDTNEKIIDLAAGMQHSIFLTSAGNVYGAGRANWHQVVPVLDPKSKTQIYIDFFVNNVLMQGLPNKANDKIIKVAAGAHHTLFLTLKGKIYALGFNSHGQCGQSNLTNLTIRDFSPVYCDLDQDESVIDIQCGKSHNVFLTSKGNVYVFGAVNHNQLSKPPEFNIDACSPVLIDLKEILEPEEKVVRLKAKFDRTALFTDKGNAYVWGGQDLSYIGSENYSLVVNIRKELGMNYNIKDIGLGYAHTLIAAEEEVQEQNVQIQ